MRKKPEAETAPREAVRHVPVEGSRRLVTVAIDDSCWRSDAQTIPFVEGAIVRMRPPIDATDERIEELRKDFIRHGAVRVFALPRPRAEVLPGGKEDVVLPKAKAMSARAAVMSLVDESNSKDKESLRALCEKVMSKVGL